MRRASCSAWPRVLNPAPGCFPLAAERGERGERVLHVALYPNHDHNGCLPTGFKRIASTYAQVDWLASEGRHTLVEDVLGAARRINPTLVWMQMQGPSSLATPENIASLRALCAHDAVLVQWDGDLHWPPDSPHREWFVRLGRLLDASLTTETEHQETYARLGVVRPGFLAVATDPLLFRPTAPLPGVPPVVFLASCHTELPGYASRYAAVEALDRDYGPSLFGVYGHGWSCASARPLLPLWEEAPAYVAAKAALSISICNDVARYSSDRLVRMLCSGSMCLVERFKDCAGLGLREGVNCLLWSGVEELEACVEWALEHHGSPEAQAIRSRASDLGLRHHIWTARMEEMQAIVDAVREARR